MKPQKILEGKKGFCSTVRCHVTNYGNKPLAFSVWVTESADQPKLDDFIGIFSVIPGSTVNVGPLTLVEGTSLMVKKGKHLVVSVSGYLDPV